MTTRTVLLPGETRRDLLSRAGSDPGSLIGSSPGEPGDAASLAKDGLKLVGICKQQAELIERKCVAGAPPTVYGQSFSRDGWRQVEAIARRAMRKSRNESMRVRYDSVARFAKHLPGEASPWDGLVAMYDVWLNTKLPIVDGVARALMRDICLKVTMAFAGRK